MLEIWMLGAILVKALKKKKCKESLSLFRQYITHNQQNVGRKMDGKGHSDKVSGGNEEHVIGSQRKGNPCYKVA